jgi:hypothetical protein
MTCDATKVDHDKDELWSQWNQAAKLMILTKPRDRPPVGQCHIEHRTTGSEATPFSSLAPSDRSAPAHGQAGDGCPSIQRHAEAKPPANLHAPMFGNPSVSHGASEKTLEMMTLEQWDQHNKKTGVDLHSERWETHDGDTPTFGSPSVSHGDSEKTLEMMTLEQWDQHNKKTGVDLRSERWETNDSDTGLGPKKEEKQRDNEQARQKRHQAMAACLKPMQVKLTCLNPKQTMKTQLQHKMLDTKQASVGNQDVTAACASVQLVD